MARISEVSIGSKFERLTVKKLYRQKGRRGYLVLMAECLCDCGKLWVGDAERLGSITRSCGCFHIDKISTHGLSKRNQRLYQAWFGMHKRCGNPNFKAYKDYGAKGVVVCSEWKDPLVFEKWAYANGYASDLSLDRIDSKGNYEPSNCRWIPMSEQSGNRRNRQEYEAWGETKSASEWLKDARCLVKNRRLIRHRVFYRKWPVEKAMTVLPK